MSFETPTISVQNSYTLKLNTEGGHPRVLVIDDEPAQRILIQEILAREGVECDCASTCAEGSDLFVKGRYACALIDLGLPDGNGINLVPEFMREDPCIVPVILTGDASPETIILTMRVGAFDYLRKPVDMVSLRAAVTRALSHHEVAKEREELFQLLVEEREQLRAKVEAATRDIRDYADACERSNEHLRTLLRFARMTAEYFSEEKMFREVFTELSRHAPVEAVTLCDPGRRKLISLVRAEEGGHLEYYRGDEAFAVSAYDALLAEAEPGTFINEWLQKNTRLDPTLSTVYVYPQVFWNRSSCTVAFYLSKEFEPDKTYREFLDASSYFLAFEWERGQLLFHIAHEASLGNIAVELARNFIQPLTAILTAGDFVNETLTSPDAKEGMRIISENVERLRRQTQEFRKLSLLRENAVETVRLNEYVEQALDMLSVAIQSRAVTIVKDFTTDTECVLLNGTILTRTFLNLILDALRAVEIGGTLCLKLSEAAGDHVAFELSHSVTGVFSTARAGAGNAPPVNPSHVLAERAVHSCGGTLSIDRDGDEERVRIVLPRNATATVAPREGLTP